MEKRYIPSELLDLVGKYKQYAEINYDILEYLFSENGYLDDIKFNYDDLVEYSNQINNIFKKYKIEARLLIQDEEEVQDEEQLFGFDLQSNPQEDITNELLIELINFIFIILSERWSDKEDGPYDVKRLNNYLKEKEAKIRVIIYGGYKDISTEAVILR